MHETVLFPARRANFPNFPRFVAFWSPSPGLCTPFRHQPCVAGRHGPSTRDRLAPPPTEKVLKPEEGQGFLQVSGQRAAPANGRAGCREAGPGGAGHRWLVGCAGPVEQKQAGSRPLQGTSVKCSPEHGDKTSSGICRSKEASSHCFEDATADACSSRLEAARQKKAKQSMYSALYDWAPSKQATRKNRLFCLFRTCVGSAAVIDVPVGRDETCAEDGRM